MNMETEMTLVEEVAQVIREHHRVHVRQPDNTHRHRRSFHQGDAEAAQAAIDLIRIATLEEAATIAHDALVKLGEPTQALIVSDAIRSKIN